MRHSLLLSLLPLFFSLTTRGQDTLTLMFAGDIMCHDAQIAAAYDSSSGTYDFGPVFAEVAPLFRQADGAVANLETTLAGEPYSGYPRFSSPDELAAACKKSGIGYLVTANNHCCDKGKRGIVRTAGVLDVLDIRHTGTFRDTADRIANNLLVIEKGALRTGLLNYTYGTNGLPAPSPTVVNRIDTSLMARDIEDAKKENLDKLIVFLHWGEQYQQHPNTRQKQIAAFLFSKGVDIIIGSHPHVLQKMEYFPADSLRKERLVVWSLGNFLSNQRKRGRDGGAMVQLSLVKDSTATHITGHGYYLTWVRKHYDGTKWHFTILPCTLYEQNGFRGIDPFSVNKMKNFLQNARTLLQEENIHFDEITEYPFPFPEIPENH